MSGRIIAWGLTGVVFGALLMLAVHLFPWVGGVLGSALGRVAASQWGAIVLVVLTTVVLTGPIAVAFYVVSGAIGRRIEFQNSDLTILGMSLTLTVGLLAPYVLYPVFVMKVLCFALFACAFNLLIGFVGLLSFGHAAYFAIAGYIAGHVA